MNTLREGVWVFWDILTDLVDLAVDNRAGIRGSEPTCTRNLGLLAFALVNDLCNRTCTLGSHLCRRHTSQLFSLHCSMDCCISGRGCKLSELVPSCIFRSMDSLGKSLVDNESFLLSTERNPIGIADCLTEKSKINKLATMSPPI